MYSLYDVEGLFDKNDNYIPRENVKQVKLLVEQTAKKSLVTLDDNSILDLVKIYNRFNKFSMVDFIYIISDLKNINKKFKLESGYSFNKFFLKLVIPYKLLMFFPY